MKISKFHECNFAIIYPIKSMWSLMWTHWNPLHTRMICAKVGWNWPSVSGEENVKRLQLDRRQMTYDQKSLFQFQFWWAKNLVFYVCGCMFVVFFFSFILVFLPISADVKLQIYSLNTFYLNYWTMRNLLKGHNYCDME